jgi:hypothetical protein
VPGFPEARVRSMLALDCTGALEWLAAPATTGLVLGLCITGGAGALQHSVGTGTLAVALK